MYCATLLFLGYVDDATTFAEGHGGAAVRPTQMGTDDDEDERAWGTPLHDESCTHDAPLFRQKEETISGTVTYHLL